MKALFAAIFFAATAHASDIDRQVIDPYVQVSAPTGTGAGVVIEHRGQLRILTAAHVARCVKRDDGTYGTLTLSKESDDGGYTERWKADVLRVSTAADLAILKPRSTKHLKPAKLRFDVIPERGEDCWYVGTAHGIHAGLERSMVNKPTCDIDGHCFLIVNGNVWYGNSGGPVFVKRGADYTLVGIVVIAVNGADPKTPGGCEPLPAIRDFLDAEPGGLFDMLRFGTNRTAK